MFWAIDCIDGAATILVSPVTGTFQISEVRMSRTELLHIALQDGFFQDEVTILVDGSELAKRSNVTTKTQIGLASTVEFRLSPGRIALDVRVAGRPPSETLVVELAQTVYVGVSVGADGKIAYKRSEQPFRYA